MANIEEHIFYVGGLLIDAMKDFHSDLLVNAPRGSDIIPRASYMRMVELRESFERAMMKF